ncbi:ATP-dependent RNA helicase RhlE [Geomonas silvestris]|uniref:ATP-dependent RNA helicase RhlE n=1 Tax=Geomonas silvestris TaxID=2740184 RepID=A0A6V8MKL1_9BACT|nr:DEAD/DEAH box helicase [Geomonas silvestris]GFO60502.1 ATP-dependent RNA helicase RhlE [Geomonas silvestris]
MSFASLGLHPELLNALADQSGFQHPYPIQKKVIPAILKGRDLLAIAKTGSGKTAAFVLPLLQLIRSQAPEARGTLRVLVLVPTRELAAQVEGVANRFARHLTPRVKTGAVFGGVAINPQMILLKGIELLVATPGRLLELVAKRSVQLSGVAALVLDEADRLYGDDFREELGQVLALLPQRRQNLMFSATFAAELEGLAASRLRDPLRVELGEEPSQPGLIAQDVYEVAAARKGPLLRFLIKDGGWKQVLVFTSSQRRADNVTKKLCDNGIAAATFHGGMSQGGRTAALAAFKTGELRVLVATDLAARGIDVPYLPHVVNYELPRSPTDYLHRIGRTGRAENPGVAVTLLAPEELQHFRVIEKRLGRRLPRIDSSEFDLSGC